MQKSSFIAFYTIFFSLLSLNIKAADSNNYPVIAGAWGDGQGGVIVVQANGRFMDVDGKDDYSVYRSSCLLSADWKKAQCHGQGVQYKTGKRFLLVSQWQLEKGKISEHWEAYFGDKNLQGQLLFRPLNNSF
ncbi:hypothetical protein NO559_03640 [Dasania sp. GY-MA-18]|uniref:Uncharacterized protein n=1 Tax=Dasania phycosphaerae TaxID=2950436 RepID=A0A9J6RHX3_9GAMM|nr:hypothetical protein [Dasania sp. GY-MA-18]MCZ0864278.1 hypothetical protein [Dasania phycosphaerae]MCZ0868006.1 hypothetical protein [Dasania phycosphaerae]